MSRVVLVMGPSGSGKSTLGTALAAELGAVFLDADDYCPAEARAKMTASIPLGDADREPWLRRLNAEVQRQTGAWVVVACSEHRERYREWLLAGLAEYRIVYLEGELEVLRERMEARRDHFMPASLLPSQLALMERPARCLVLDVRRPLPELVAAAREYAISS